MRRFRKPTRADLHERFASWLEEHGTELVELDELLGYHLEQSCGYRAELGTPDDGALASAARRRLVAGGLRAVSRQDYGAAVSLLERAATLVRPDEFDLAIEIELGEALFWTGRADDALRRADLLAERAAATGDRVGEISGKIMAGVSRRNLRPEGATEELAASHRAGLARASRPPATTWRCISPTQRSPRWPLYAHRWTRRWTPTNGPSRTLVRPASCRLGASGSSPRLATSGLPLRPISSRGSTRTNPEQGGTSSSAPTAP